MAQSLRRLQTLSVHNHFRNVRLFKEQELGRGSFATVCRAACDSLLCAAKVLHPEFFDQGDPGEENFLAKFIEECNILPSITHPNIVQCFGTYQDPETDLPVLLMELMDESLTGYLERAREPLPFHAEVSFSYDVALGLSYLHSRGYIHRDLSSNNVLIMAGVRAKITDFGMCRATPGPRYGQSRLTQCPGTQVYMPPEALVEHPVYTAMLDVFSYGVLIIQIMSRQFPMPGPAHRMLPTSGLLQAIAEEERRANHIQYVNFDHQMLPLAKRCIQNSHSLRPSSDEICSALSLLKESRYYQQSKDEDSVERKLVRAKIHCRKVEEIRDQLQHELEKKELDHKVYCQEVQSMHYKEIDRLRREYSQKIESIRNMYEHKLREQANKLMIESSPLSFCCNDSANVRHNESIPFDPDNLPAPAYDPHDLEMFHQEEAHTPDDSLVSDYTGMFIDARSTNFDDFSGPNLDDQLSFRSDDSGHMGLSQRSIHGECENTLKQTDFAEAVFDDTCKSGIHVTVKNVERVEEAQYEEVRSKNEEGGVALSEVSFMIGHDVSPADGQQPSLAGQTVTSSSPVPKPRPRSFSGGKKLDAPKSDPKPTSVPEGVKPMPRPRSQQNLLSAKVRTPPPSPPRTKPEIKPRKTSPDATPHATVVHESDTQDKPKVLSPKDDSETNTLSILPGSNITSVYSTSSLTTCENDQEQESLSLVHSEAHTSDESDSPLPSIEETPSMSSKSDPYPGTSYDNTSSACSGEKTFTDIDVHDSLGSWVQVDVETHHEEKQPSSLDKEPTFIRKRSDAFSTRPAKAAQDVENILDPRLVQDIQSAISCWYCTNMTNERVCDVCGNIQPQNRDTRV